MARPAVSPRDQERPFGHDERQLTALTASLREVHAFHTLGDGPIGDQAHPSLRVDDPRSPAAAGAGL